MKASGPSNKIKNKEKTLKEKRDEKERVYSTIKILLN